MRATNDSIFERIRELVTGGLMAILIGTAVYTFLGFAWTFKAAVEASHKLRHPFS